MNARKISNERIQVTFGTEPFTIIKIYNNLTGQSISQKGRQTFLVRLPLEPSEPIFLNHIQSMTVDDRGIRFIVTDATKTYGGSVLLADSVDGICFQVQIKAPKPIWMMEWQLSGLQINNVIIPALGGQVLDASMPVDTTVSFKYPFWWNAQFAIGSTQNGGIWLRTKDSTPDLKMLRVKKEKDGFAVTYGFEATAPLRLKTLQAVWYLDCYKGNWKIPVDIHRQWLEQAFGLRPLQQNPYFPPWANKINFVLELWGMRKDQLQPHHTFEDMINRIKVCKKIHPPEQTLVYLPGYAGRGIDSNAPDYHPSTYLGGNKIFKKFVQIAHDLGFYVMIHTNTLAMSFTHSQFPKFKKYQVVDVFGRTQGWGLDLDGDWLSEPYFAYINPGAKVWGDLMEEVLGNLIHTYDLDAVFLDQTLLAFNVSKGPNFLMGMRNHIQRLQRAFPDILFAGEGLHEHVVGVLPMAQIHGIDSIAEVHGMEGKKTWRSVHPVSDYLFSKYTRFIAHLLTRHPSNPMFAVQEEAYAKLGVIPALCLYDQGQSMEGPEVKRMLQRARKLHFPESSWEQ